MREAVVQACAALRTGTPKNMGECVELFDVASNEEEAAAITTAYAFWIMLHNGVSEAEATALARRNTDTGLSYMDRDEALAVYRAASPSPDTKEGEN